MNHLTASVLGVAASVCSMVSFAPQLQRLWREKDARAISLRTYAVTTTGFILWTAYGLVIRRWPIVVSNIVCALMAIGVLSLAVRYKSPKSKIGAG